MPRKATEKIGPRRSVLSDETYDMIRDMILAHKIAPGAKVNIDALALELGVSQTPIREALARLESDGLISKEALKGYSTTNLLTLKQFENLYQFRLLIEPWAAEQAAKSIDTVGIAALKSELMTAKNALKFKARDQIRAFIEHDARFHSLIARIAGNDSVTEAFERTHCHLHLFRMLLAMQSTENSSQLSNKAIAENIKAFSQTASGERTIEEHSAISNAIMDKNAKAARSAMQAHIQSSLDRFTPATMELNK